MKDTEFFQLIWNLIKKILDTIKAWLTGETEEEE